VVEPARARTASGARRVPVQARSQKRVEAIVTAARDLLLAAGPDQLTVERLARVAGVPVGTIYQFFGSKDAVLNELARPTLERAERFFATVDDPAFVALPWEAQVDGLIDAMVDAWVTDPLLDVIWGPDPMTPELAAAEAQLQSALTARLERTVAAAAPELPRARRRRSAAVLRASILAVLDAWAQDGRRDRQLAVELARMLKAYLAAPGGPGARR